MSKKIVCCVVALVTALLCIAVAVGEGDVPEGAVVISASSASFTEGKGVTPANKKAATVYDPDTATIVNLAQDARVTFTVPETVNGVYDVYLNISKILAQHTSQPFSFTIGDGECFSVEMDCVVPADSAFANNKDGTEYNVGKLTDMGTFVVRRNVKIQGGDQVNVICSFGCRHAKLKAVAYPAVGDLWLVPHGTAVALGYDHVIPEEKTIDETDILSGKKIIWLGSSVTYGASAAGHYSMVDAIEALHPALTCEKYAISATTLVNSDAMSYVNRLKLIPKEADPDMVIIQLSTNDATTGKPFGEITQGFDLKDFDDQTIAGAIETIIAYARDTWNCPVMFYTGTYCQKENYAEMVQLLLEIQKKWNIGVIDMFNNAEMTKIYDTELYHEYMADEVHPCRRGYIEWWAPVMDAEIIAYMESYAQ